MYPSSYVLQIKKLRIRNLLTYGDSDWIELGRRTLIVGPNGSGKTNIIRALRLLRAAVGLEGSIQETELRSYLHDLGKSSAGIDLEISLSEGEAVDACQLFCSYYNENQGWISPGPSCEGLKERLAGDARISFLWISADGESPLGSSGVKALYAIWFSKANFGVLLRAESPQMTADYVKVRSEYIYCSGPEVNPRELYKLYKKYDEVNKNCSGQKPFETQQKIYGEICGESGGEEKGVCGGSEPECVALPPVPIERSPFREIVERYGLLQLLPPVPISPSHETARRILFTPTPVEDFSYPAGYILLLIVLSNIVFAGSERMLSDASKLAALRRLIEKEPNHDLAAIIDSTLGWAREEQLDAYLRNVGPFLAYLYFSETSENAHHFYEISKCLEHFSGAQLMVRPEILDDTHYYHGIYLREKVGGREVPIDVAGQGHRELLSLLTALIGRPGSVVFLDEPASNMHPTLLYQFLMDLLGHGKCSEELGRDQVVVITHSPAVAKLFMEADVGASKKNPTGEGLPDLSIIRVHRDERDGASVINYLTPDKPQDKQQGGSEEFLKKAVGRMVDPRVLFARGVVLCEGPADHAFLREALRLSENSSKNSEKWNELLRNDVELVWMNGKDNLVTYDKVLNKLGIPYVAVLDFDALCEVLSCRKENEWENHPLYNKHKCKEVLVLTPSKLNELNDSGELGRYRYVLLLDGDSVPDQLDCNDARVLNSVQEYCNNECINKDDNCKKKNSKKCELEGFLEVLGMDLSGCTDNDGKLKPESVPECVERQNEVVKGKIKQIGDILFKLINANILGGSTNATASY